ncbi:SGNH hydrolase-type esterase domain-containing protein [Calycina marina]|uniref:SGNH hydrolase-type esterase domain-containing protein n=1 Tax=Calycina marina TaxID=1763456 RepID=A0A9P7YY26_9HELO|nr:SGNH hydrolase-type esterase domain-containing protein [Calycina marina]
MYFASSLVTLGALSSVALGAIENKRMRMMPLGASITYGTGSSTGNGYRRDLLQKLTAGNNTVNFIGSQTSGNMTNNRNEGHPGLTIDQMLEVSKDSLTKLPNVILLLVGTNDILANKYKTVPKRMGDTIDGLVKACPDATILVSQLTTSTNATIADRIEEFDTALVPIVKSRADAGKHIALVDMSKILDTKRDFHDNIHPNNAGYAKIADAWYNALETADSKGWIKDPIIAPGKQDDMKKTTTTTDSTHSESASASDHKDHDKNSKVNADGSSFSSNTDSEDRKSAAAAADSASKETTTTGPTGTTTSKNGHENSASASNSDSSEQSASTNISADGVKTTTKTEEEASAAAAAAASASSSSVNTVTPNGSRFEGSYSSDDSSSSSSSDSTSSSTTTYGKRSAKFRLM